MGKNPKNPKRIGMHPNSLENLKHARGQGRKKTPPEIKEMFEASCAEAVQLLINTMHDSNAKPELRVQCANEILNRGIGKPLQQTINENINVNLSETLEESKEKLNKMLEAI